MVHEALRAARRLGDPVAIGRVLLSYRFCGGPLDLAERLACGTELVELGDRIGVELFSYIGCQQLWWCYRELGDRDQMDDWYAEATRRIRLPDVEQMSYAPSVALLDGDLPHVQRTTDVLSEAWDETASAVPTPRRCAWPSRIFAGVCRTPGCWSTSSPPARPMASMPRRSSLAAGHGAVGWRRLAISSRARKSAGSRSATPHGEEQRVRAAGPRWRSASTTAPPRES